MKSESFHVVVINDINAQVKQIFAVFFHGSDQGAHIQFELVQNGFIHDAVAVDEMTEEAVFLDGGEILFRYLQVAGSAGIGLYSVHGVNVLMINV